MSAPRPRMVRAVYAKEITDTLRDRRTLATMVLVPMVTYPLMLIAASEAALIEKEAAKSRTVGVMLLGEVPAPVADALRGDPAISVMTETSSRGAGVDEAELARALIAHDTASLVVASATGARAALEGMGTAHLRLYFDETEAASRAARDRVEERLDHAAADVTRARLGRLGLRTDTIRPLSHRAISVATHAEVGGELASRFLPMLILVFIAISCFYPAIELTAGEKERGTLATLLTAPVEASEIVLGKYLVVVTVGVLAGLLNVTVMTLTVLRAIAGASENADGAPIAALPHPTPGLVFGLLAAVALVAAVIAAVMLLAATFARSFRDANTLLTPVLLLVMAPAFLASFPSAELDARWAALPVAGPVLWMKSLLLDKPVGSVALGVVGSSAGTAFLLLGLATRVFGDERALFSSEGRRADAKTLLFGAPELGPGSAVAFASVLFIGNFFVGALLLGVHPLIAVLITQVVLHAGLSLAFARWTRAPRLLSLGQPVGGALPAAVAAILVGGGAWLGCSMPLMWLQAALVPGQAAASEAFERNLSLAGVPLPLVLGALAVVPAIAEELAFRGVVQGALRVRWRASSAIALSALLFALSHGSLFRVLPTFVLGLFLGLIAERTKSLWPSMAAHALNNGILLALDRASPEALARLTAPTAWAAAGAAAVAIGVVTLRLRLTRPTSDT